MLVVQGTLGQALHDVLTIVIEVARIQIDNKWESEIMKVHGHDTTHAYISITIYAT